MSEKNLPIQLNFRASEPIYLQIANQIEKLVAGGQLKPGDQLPTVRELATTLGVNFNTVARAYRILDETHLISTQRGRGTYIWEKPTQEHLHLLRVKSLEEILHPVIEEALGQGFTAQEIIDVFATHMADMSDRLEAEGDSHPREEAVSP